MDAHLSEYGEPSECKAADTRQCSLLSQLAIGYLLRSLVRDAEPRSDLPIRTPFAT